MTAYCLPITDYKGVSYTVNDRKAAAYRLGFITLIILAVLTAVEFWVSVSLGSAVLLFIIALIKTAFIVQNFMHISRLWREEESH
jgi:hypothetical protein